MQLSWTVSYHHIPASLKTEKPEQGDTNRYWSAQRRFKVGHGVETARSETKPQGLWRASEQELRQITEPSYFTSHLKDAQFQKEDLRQLDGDPWNENLGQEIRERTRQKLNGHLWEDLSLHALVIAEKL